ncbi:MAG: RNA-binding protein [Candidatus Pacearchaeota archaeon]
MSEDNKTKENEKAKTNEIFVGNKPIMKYVTACLMQLGESNNKEIRVKARGKFISKAVDIAEVVKKNYKEKTKSDLKNEISISTEQFEGKEGKKINISIIDIALSK